jgi:hypothetical protein
VRTCFLPGKSQFCPSDCPPASYHNPPYRCQSRAEPGRRVDLIQPIATPAWLACDPLRCLARGALHTAQLLTAAGCSSSQIATDKPTAVPLWKVIVGARAGRLCRTRKGPVFLSRQVSGSGRVDPEGPCRRAKLDLA